MAEVLSFIMPAPKVRLCLRYVFDEVTLQDNLGIYLLDFEGQKLFDHNDA